MKKILNVATFGLAGALLGGKKKAADPVAAPPPPAMPTADDNAILRARKRTIVQQLGRKGRDSTNLTGDRLGG